MRINPIQTSTKRLAGILGLVLLGGGCAFTPEHELQARSGYTQRALDPATISVLSWNIEKGQAHNWASALINGQVHARLQNTDLLLVQEACVSADGRLQDFERYLRHYGYGWRFATSFVSGVWGCGDDQATGVFIASRVAPIQTLALRSQDSEFNITPKASLAMLFPVARSPAPLLVINSHMLNFQLFSNSDYENQLLDLLDIIDQHRGPVIFAGDLNTRNQARLDLLAEAMARYCLRPLNPQPPDRRTTDRLHENFVLDHILYRGLRPQTALSVGNEEEAGIADHNSIAGIFQLSPGAGCQLL